MVNGISSKTSTLQTFRASKAFDSLNKNSDKTKENSKEKNTVSIEKTSIKNEISIKDKNNIDVVKNLANQYGFSVSDTEINFALKNGTSIFVDKTI